ncbi:MAG TPA: hypothetical protein VFB63_08700 [Bryobacteraceae bacterium]|nr:hypothetical protein [Bryobacteraceae bacterium]
MRRLLEMRALMICMSVSLLIAAVGCTKPSEPPQGQAPPEKSEVQGVPANPGSPSSTPQTQPLASRPAPVVPKPAPVTVAEGTAVAVRTVQTLSTKTAENGTKFEATLREPLIAGSYVVAPKGARAFGVVSNSDDGGRVKGRASITVQLTSLEVDGREVDITTSSVTHVAKGTKKEDAVKVGVASGIGAAIGAIAGGGKGAAIGAGAGAGAGTGVVLATKGDPAVIPSEAPLTFKLRAPLTVTRN